MTITITGYNALCNLGSNIDEIYKKAIEGKNDCFDYIENYLPQTVVRAGIIHGYLPKIAQDDYNIRCNQLILKNLELLKNEISALLKKYPNEKIGVIGASTNSGTDEFEKSHNPKHYQLSNPAEFLRNNLGLKGFCSTVSTACSSGIKAISNARDLLNKNICNAVIVVCVDTLAKLPVFGFHSLEVLTCEKSNPFGKNRQGMNIGEACAIFILENNEKGIEVMGIGETSDIYHPTTPDPDGKEAIKAIEIALKEAKLKPENIDYINAHGTGTVANDIMESNAIYSVFKDKVPVSSTKPLTGHCLGSASGIETALCCKLLENFDGKLYPHIYSGEFDDSLPEINLVSKDKTYEKCKICMCNSFGFGGTNAIIILGRKNG